MGVESYMHKYAKVVLSTWLRKKIRIGETYQGLSNVPLPSKKEAPMYNTYVEYPICKAKNNVIVGLKPLNVKNGHSWSEWLKNNGKKVSQKHNIPTSFELKQWETELTPLHIFDIAVLDSDNKIHSVFEIQHQHPITEHKKKFLVENKIKGYEISAEWIMNKVKSPFTIDCIQVIN
jgi:hypothetical protein